MLEGGKSHGLTKVEKSTLALGSEERVQVAILNRVVRIDLIEKVTFKQSGKGISHISRCIPVEI